MTHPGPDPAPSWQQPPIVLTGPGFVDGEDPEPPMWAQPGEAAALTHIAAAPPARRGSRWVNLIRWQRWRP
ncbi:MAG TPA: hypothetical protein VGK17_21955 [Propionicimonas sp.]